MCVRVFECVCVYVCICLCVGVCAGGWVGMRGCRGYLGLPPAILSAVSPANKEKKKDNLLLLEP